MGSDQGDAAHLATVQNMAMSDTLYGFGSQGLKSGLSYLGSARAMGGTLDQTQKYDAIRSNFMSSTAGMNGSFLDPQGMGDALSGRASGLSGVGSEQIGGAVDEMNKIRSLLAGQGLKTTGLAASAGGLETDALRYMNPGNATGSLIKGAAGAGAAIYGAGNQQGWWGQASQTVPGGAASGWTNPATGMGGTA